MCAARTTRKRSKRQRAHHLRELDFHFHSPWPHKESVSGLGQPELQLPRTNNGAGNEGIPERDDKERVIGPIQVDLQSHRTNSRSSNRGLPEGDDGEKGIGPNPSDFKSPRTNDRSSNEGMPERDEAKRLIGPDQVGSRVLGLDERIELRHR